MVVLIAHREFITDEMLQEIASVDGVAGYDAALVAMLITITKRVRL